MARININIPEPTSEYTEENQRQVAQSLQTLKDKLNTSYQEELKQEVERVSWYTMR
jgi:DNA primase